MEKKEIKRIKALYFLARGLTSYIGLTFGVHALMLKHSGLGFTEIGFVSAVFMGSVFLFEVPTGSLADAFGHAKIFIAGTLVDAVGLTIYFLGNNFWHFAIAELVLAFAAAMMSGSLEAWAVNRFRDLGWKNRYNNFFSRAYLIERLAILIMVWVGAKIGYHFGLSWPYLLAAGLALGTAVVIFLLLKDGKDKKQEISSTGRWNDFCANIVAGRRVIAASRRLGFLLGVSFIISLIVQPVNIQWSILYELRFNTIDTSAIVAIQIIGTIAGAMLVMLYSRAVKQITAQFLLISGGIILTIVAIPASRDWWVFAGVFFIHEIPRGMMMPLRESWVGELVSDNKCRATVNSYFGMTWTLAAGLGLLVSGYWSEWFGIAATWSVISCSGGAIIAVLAFFTLKGTKKLRRAES